jgi:hypothetical protein
LITHGLLLRQITGRAQDYDNGVVLELLVAVRIERSAVVLLLHRRRALHVSRSYPSITRRTLRPMQKSSRYRAK